RSTWPAWARPGMACSRRTWTPPCPGRYSSCSARLDAHVLHARRLGGHARGVRRADRGGRARRPAGHADPRAGARSLACSRRMRSRAALGRRAQPRHIARRDVARRDDLGRGRYRARPHGPGPRRPCLPGRGRRRRRGQRPGLLGGRGVRALGGDRELRLIDGRLGDARTAVMRAGAGDEGLAGAEAVARALTEAVRPLGGTDPPAELSLTGGKDSRLVAAALAAAQVPFRSRTHGFAGHPDVVVAGLIAAKLGVEHTVTRPRPPGAPDEADVLGRLRAAVLVSDGMLSAFENLGSGFRPNPQAAGEAAETGGHGGELLRGGYAQAAWRTPAAAAAPLNAAAAGELFRRMTTRRLGLLRPGAARAYLATLAAPAAALARGPLAALDDFYLANRAGRWSAAARQAYLLRSPLVQPLFADRVVR